MLDHLPPRRRRTVLGALAILALVAAAVVGTLTVRALVPTDRADQGSTGPVLLVPGYGGDVDALDPLVARLQELGREVIVIRPDDGGTGDLRAQARRLAPQAAAAARASDAGSVDVVGYSAGGVVARLWVRDEGGDAIARRVLTIGSPHHGTDLAALAREVAGTCPEACRQLDPDSDLLRALNAGDETPDGPAWSTVRSPGDRVVTPTDSSLLSGALNVDVSEVCTDSLPEHGELPGDPVVLALLSTALAEDAPAAPADVSC